MGSYPVYGHVLLGLVILGLAHYNNAQIKKTDAPNRLKRIAKSTAILATIQPIFGLILLVNLMLSSAIPLVGVLVGIVFFLHLITALAIITQASSVATAYDMWEEKEYTKTYRGDYRRTHYISRIYHAATLLATTESDRDVSRARAGTFGCCLFADKYA